MNNKNISKARELRKNSTEQELKIWKLLRNRQLSNYKFRRQYPIGPYIVDFICREKRLIIELDGGQHNENRNIMYDTERTKYLELRGYKVIRFWNNDIDNNIEGVYKSIQSKLRTTVLSLITLPLQSERVGVRFNCLTTSIYLFITI